MAPFFARLVLTTAATAAAVHATAQSVIVSDSTVRTVASFSLATGDLEALGFMDLDDGAISSNRPYQSARVGNELWFTDDVTGRITRWDSFGANQLGAIDLSPNRLRGITAAFGFVWVGAGTPSGAVQDYLAQLTLGGSLVALHPMPGVINGVVAFGNQLLVADSDHDDLLLVDPSTGTVSGVFHDSDGVSGIDSPQELQTLPSGNVLAAGGLPPSGVFEYDASGTQVQFVDASSLPIPVSVRGVQRLLDGRTLVTSGTGLFRYDPATQQFEQLAHSLTLYYFNEVPSIPIGTPECGPAVVNSTGRPGTTTAVGSHLLSDNAIRLCAQDLPNASTGYFLCSQTPGFVATAGGSQGTLCLGGSVGRLNQQIGFTAGDGFFSATLDPSNVPQPTGFVSIVAGETWRFQCWYRDANPNVTSNFTNAMAVMFQ